MLITDEEYLKEFGLEEVPEAEKVPFHGWEMDHTASITLDGEGGYSIGYVLWDDIEPNRLFKAKKGVAGRWTYVVIHQDGKTIEDHGYEFKGLIPPDLLRDWARAKLKIKDPEPVKE